MGDTDAALGDPPGVACAGVSSGSSCLPRTSGGGRITRSRRLEECDEVALGLGGSRCKAERWLAAPDGTPVPLASRVQSQPRPDPAGSRAESHGLRTGRVEQRADPGARRPRVHRRAAAARCARRLGARSGDRLAVPGDDDAVRAVAYHLPRVHRQSRDRSRYAHPRRHACEDAALGEEQEAARAGAGRLLVQPLQRGRP